MDCVSALLDDKIGAGIHGSLLIVFVLRQEHDACLRQRCFQTSSNFGAWKTLQVLINQDYVWLLLTSQRHRFQAMLRHAHQVDIFFLRDEPNQLLPFSTILVNNQKAKFLLAHRLLYSLHI